LKVEYVLARKWFIIENAFYFATEGYLQPWQRWPFTVSIILVGHCGLESLKRNTNGRKVKE